MTPTHHNIPANNLCVRSLSLPLMGLFKNWLREQINIPMFTQRNRHCPGQWFSGVMALVAALETHWFGQFNCLGQGYSNEENKTKMLSILEKIHDEYSGTHDVQLCLDSNIDLFQITSSSHHNEYFNTLSSISSQPVAFIRLSFFARLPCPVANLATLLSATCSFPIYLLHIPPYIGSKYVNLLTINPFNNRFLLSVGKFLQQCFRAPIFLKSYLWE